MKLSVIALIFVGLIAAVSVAVLVGSLQASLTGRSTAATAEPEQVTVVVAKRALAAMTVVTADAIEERTIPADQAPPGRLVSSLQIVGNALVVPVVEGQVFTSRCFAGGARGLDLAAVLQPGKRAMTVSLADYAGMEGLLYPGAIVDVLASFQLMSSSSRLTGRAISTTLLRGVQVLAIEDLTIRASADADDEEGDRRSVRARAARELKVTLLVDSKQAEALQLAMEHGSVSLALRNPLDANEVDRDATMLSEGRLAKLASFLPPSVGPGGDDRLPAELLPEDMLSDEEPPQPQQTAAADPPPAPEPPQEYQWDVYILRGGQVEVRTFKMRPDQAAQWLPADDDRGGAAGVPPAGAQPTAASPPGATQEKRDAEIATTMQRTDPTVSQ